MLITALLKAFHNLFMPGVLRLFMFCLLAYALGGGVLALLAGYALSAFAEAGAGSSALMQMAGTIGGGVAAWFMFPLLYPILVSFFDDYMAEVIEARDYPQLPKTSPPFWPTFVQDALFSAKALLINLVCMVFYLIPLIGWLLYLAINGYLLGMQFFRMSAGRRINKVEAEALMRRNRGVIVLAGMSVMLCASIPFLNLAAPLLGVATMLHLFHALNGTDKTQVLSPLP